jgi:hypothetical protein
MISRSPFCLPSRFLLCGVAGPLKKSPATSSGFFIWGPEPRGLRGPREAPPRPSVRDWGLPGPSRKPPGPTTNPTKKPMSQKESIEQSSSAYHTRTQSSGYVRVLHAAGAPEYPGRRVWEESLQGVVVHVPAPSFSARRVTHEMCRAVLSTAFEVFATRRPSCEPKVLKQICLYHSLGKYVTKDD